MFLKILIILSLIVAVPTMVYVVGLIVLGKAAVDAVEEEENNEE